MNDAIAVVIKNIKTIFVTILNSNFKLFLNIINNPIKHIKSVFILMAVLPKIIENGIRHKKKLKNIDELNFGITFKNI